MPQLLKELNDVKWKQQDLAICTFFLSKKENKILVDAASWKFNDMSLVGDSMYIWADLMSSAISSSVSEVQ
jgi:hypothetical protein